MKEPKGLKGKRQSDSVAPEPLQSIVARWMKFSGLDAGLNKYKVFCSWNEVAEESIKEHTHPLRFVDQVLEVAVDSPAYYFELVNFQKQGLLKKIQQVSEIYVKNIEFVCDGKTHDDRA